MGFHVAWDQVRQATRTTDPLNTALRLPGGLTSRRPYSVPGPNSLWHIGYLPIHIIFERLEAVTVLNIWRVIQTTKVTIVTPLPSGQ